MQRRLFLAALMAFGVLSACDNSSSRQTDGPEQTSVTVAQWGSERYLIYLPLYIAMENGYFAENGLNVSIEYSGNDDQVFAKVLRGDAQFGVGDPIFTAVSRQQGADGVVLATIVGRVALWGVSKTERNLQAPQDFSGLRVGTFPRPSTTFTLLTEMLSNPGVSDAEVVEVPIGNELALLESGSADVVMLLEPAASIAAAEGYHIVTSFPGLWGDFEFTGLTSTQTYIDASPETAKSMVDALQMAVEFAHANPDGATDVAAGLFPSLDRAVVAAAVSRMLDDETLPENVSVDREAWNKSMITRQKVGDIEGDFLCEECLVQLE